MTEKIDVKKKPSKVPVLVLRGYRYAEETPTRRKGKVIKINQSEFKYAYENGYVKGV